MFRFLLLGLGTGAIYALIGHGMVLVYRGSGVLNFAQGAFAALGAVSYYELHVRVGLPVAPAVLVALLACGLAGALMQFVVMRPLRHAPPLTRVIATLGVMVALQQAGHIIFGSEIRTVPSFLPTRSVSVAGTRIGADRFVLLAVAVVISVVLWAFYRYSRFGAVTAAVAESERAAQIMGHSPDVVAGLNWVLGAMLAGAAGILIVPITGLDIDTLVLLIIPALATGVLAGFSSFAVALAASLVIGIAQSEISHYVSASGWSEAVPFIFVVVVLVVRGRALPLRGHVNEVLPEIGAGILRPGRIAVALAVGLVLVLASPASWTDAFTTSILGAVLAVSLVVVTGYAGQLSLAQYAFAGWGGYVASRLAATHGIPFLLAVVIGMLAAVPVGVLVGLPALRTRGIHLAIATFGLAYSFQSVLFQSTSLTGGLTGTVVPSPTLFGWNVDSTIHPRRFAVVGLVALLLVALVAANLRRGRSGRRLVAVRANERAAASLGISLYGAKLYSFALSGAIAGLGGVLLAFRSTFVDFSQFNVFSSIAVVIDTVIGGVGFLVGALISGANAAGGLSTRIVSLFFSSDSLAQYVTLALAVLLVPTLVSFPNGLAARLSLDRIPFPVRRRGGTPVAGDDDAGETSSPEEERVAPVRVADRRAPAPPHRVPPRILEVADVSVSYGGVKALSGVSLRVRPGEVVGLMGPNGAGKTTLIDAVTGFTGLRGGSILLDGNRIDGLRAHRRAQRGIGRTFQSLELFDQMTVLENLRTASDPRNSAAYLTDLVHPRTPALTSAARSAIAMFELGDVFDRVPAELSYGRRRQVAIARAIAAQPSILLLDEPAAGLHESETEELGVMLRRLAEEWGVGILLVEHDVPLLNQVCDQLVVMDFGSVISVGTPAEIRSDPKVIAAYLGADGPDGAEGQEDPEPRGTAEVTSHVG